MNKTCFRFLLPILWLFHQASDGLAQDDSKILQLTGGRIQNEIMMTSNLFYGMGGRSAHLGGSICSFHPDASMAFWNPALLSSLRQTHLQMDFSPKLSVDVAAFVDMDGEIRAATDDAIADYRDPTLQPIYSQVGLKFRQQNCFSSAILAVPVHHYTVAAYFLKPVNLNIRSSISGVRARVISKLDQDDVFLNSFIDGHLRLQVGAQIKGIAIGKKITPQWSAGIAFEHYNTRLWTEGFLNVEGTMVTGGKEYSFNDPNDAWHNDLNQLVDADYEGSEWGWKLACSYLLQEDLNLAAIFDWAPDIQANGYANVVNNTIPALSLDLFGSDNGNPDGEILDPEKLKLSQLTLTRKVATETFTKLTLRLPKTFKLAVAWRFRPMILHLNYALGFSPTGLKYGVNEIGFKPTHALRLGLDFNYLQAGFGFAIFNKVAKGSSNLGEDNGTATFLPLFSLGSGFDWLEHYRVDLLVLAVPMPILKITLGYKF